MGRAMADPISTRIGGLLGLRRDLLSVLALTGQDLDRTEWAQYAARCRIRVDPRRAMGASTLRPEIAPCLASGLLVETKHSATRATYRVEPEIALALLKEADSRYRLEELVGGVRQELRTARQPGFGAERRRAEWVAELRVALSRADEASTRRLTQEGLTLPLGPNETPGSWLALQLGHRPGHALLALVHADALPDYVAYEMERALEQLLPLGEGVLRAAGESKSSELRLEAARCHCLRGEYEEALALEGLPKGAAALVELSASLWRGDFAAARAAGDVALKATRRRKHRQLLGMEGVFLEWARVAGTVSGGADWEALERDARNAAAAKAQSPDAYLCLLELHRTASRGELPSLPLWEFEGRDWLSLMSFAFCRHWLGLQDRRSELRNALRPWLARAQAGGYAPLVTELSALLQELDGETPDAQARLFTAYEAKAPWEVALESLEALTREEPKAPPAEDKKPAQRELVFRVVEVEGQAPTVEARLRTRAGQKGKPASPARLLEGEGIDLTESDRLALALLARVHQSSRSRGRADAAEVNRSPLLALVDHPRVVNEDGSSLAVKQKDAELRSRPDGEDVVLEIYPQELAWGAFAHEWQSPREIWVYERSAELTRVARALPGGSLRVPGQETGRLSSLVQGLGSRVTLGAQSDSLEVAEVVSADPAIAVELDWDGTRLSLGLVVFPLGIGAGSVRPGEGSGSFVGPVDGQLKRCDRDFDAERKALDALEVACPTLSHLPRAGNGRRADSVESSLDCLSELHGARPAVRLLWPKEHRLEPPKLAGLETLRARVGQANGWLEVSPTLEIDEGHVLTLRDLLGRRRGNYVELGEERFLRLTDDLARRLDAIDSLGAAEGDGVRAGTASLARVEELFADAEGVDYSEDVMGRLERLHAAAGSTPTLPRNFDATLRDYQLEGFHFLARLADAGMGACLADDMGLGKTVQTLALLLRRAKLGPTLIVAPTTVVRNWASEATRFAPTLRCLEFAEGDRAQTLSELGPRDILLTSYGLLVSEAERLAEVNFATVVFDEAHALKNARTRRAQAAHGLSAGLRVALTGTPIENHLGELWSVMEATLPGLLGTQSHFDKRFAQPIEAGDRERASQLRSMLRPFILRRTKAQVLDELPDRTEITLRVQPTPAERAFYEALRRNAVEAFSAKGAKNQKRMRVFAEIMRLRRAAVDPRLVDPELGPPGAKLDALVERLVALKEEGHRALVFSQFLGSLDMARQRLEEEGIEHLMLDGSTSTNERARRIEAFQDGEADVFLMSLQAGGVGVNLTGADYVIHLDPWWNPAVEEQATGRAHRIGQRRPVTVYRFVTEGSIEERILAMHKQKRDLADDVLSGLDQSRRLDLDELRSLLLD